MNEKIKDSGSTQEYSNGAHRDNATGKGRMDLVPLIEASMVMFDDPVLYNIGKFMETRDTKYLAQAIRETVETVDIFHYQTMVESLIAEGIQMRVISADEPDAKISDRIVAYRHQNVFSNDSDLCAVGQLSVFRLPTADLQPLRPSQTHLSHVVRIPL